MGAQSISYLLDIAKEILDFFLLLLHEKLGKDFTGHNLEKLNIATNNNLLVVKSFCIWVQLYYFKRLYNRLLPEVSPEFLPTEAYLIFMVEAEIFSSGAESRPKDVITHKSMGRGWKGQNILLY